MNPIDEMLMETETTRAETPEGAEIIRPYATRAWDELARMTLTPAEMIWGNFTLGENGSMFGPPGIGKSRISLNSARNQVLSTPFGGLPTCPRPLRHLLMGSENSIRRLQNDIRKMNAGLTHEQVAKLGAHIRLATLEGPEDSFISVASPVNVERWRATLDAFKPEVLWVDPWGDVLDGEGNKDEDARLTHSILSRLLRKATPGDSTMIVMAHSRMGAKNLMTATGYDSGNYGKGSKALQAISRCYWNIAPGDETETPPVLLFNPKASNYLPYPPIAMRLDSETMLYSRDSAFDFDAWQAEVAQRVNGKGGRKALVPLESFRPHVLSVLEAAGGALPSGVLHVRVGAAIPGGLGQRRIAALVDDCLAAGIIAKTPRAKEHGGKVYVGTPGQIEAFRNPKLPFEEGEK